MAEPITLSLLGMIIPMRDTLFVTRPRWRSLRRHDLISLSRAVVVGLLQNGFFYGVTLLLLLAGWKAWQAAIVCYPAGVLASFLANRHWSFAQREYRPGQFSRYLILYALIYPTTVGLNWLQETHGVPSWLASLITMATLTLVMLAALNFWVFHGEDT